MNTDPEHTTEPTGPPSKSQRKREATALQDMGAKLVELKPAQLEKLPLPVELRDAILFAQGLSQRGARKRQLQYIGKLMRRIDPEPVRAALAILESRHSAAKRRLHDLERLCEALVAGDEAALAEFLARHPDADRQQLHQLMRTAAREQTQGKPPKARRALFRYLRELEGPVQEEP